MLDEVIMAESCSDIVTVYDLCFNCGQSGGIRLVSIKFTQFNIYANRGLFKLFTQGSN